MSRLAKYLISAVAAVVLAGCASMSSNEIHVSESEKANPNASKVKYLASIRIAGYVDARNVSEPRKIGKCEVRVIGYVRGRTSLWIGM